MWNFLLFGLSHAYLITTGTINVSTQLTSFTAHLRVVFFDFDNVLTVASTSSILNLCDTSGACTTYTPAAACTCNQTTTALGDFVALNASDQVLAEPGVFFNGTDRRDRLAATFALILSKGIELKILSTSVYYQNAANWQYYLQKVFDVANLSQYIPSANIFTLDDPGQGIAADKGAFIAAYLASRNWTAQNALLVDDSEGNLNSAHGKADWMYVFPDGLTLNQLSWIETRANQTFAVNCSALTEPSSGSVGTCTTARVTGDNCSINCINGYTVVGSSTQQCVAGTPTWLAAFSGNQSCVVANCSALPAPAFGSVGTCTSLKVTGNSCSISCNDGYALRGWSTQQCTGSGPGNATFDNSQSCRAVNCSALTAPAFGSVGTCTNKVTGDNCSISCGDGYTVVGPATQQCVGTGPGASAFPNSQSCLAARCSTPVVPNGTAGSCVSPKTGQNCSITCRTGFAVAGPSFQTCAAMGPAASALPNSQGCVASPAACPSADLANFLALCGDTDLQTVCRELCALAASWIVTDFQTSGFTAQFTEACIRNASARSSTPLNAANTNYVVTQVTTGGSICRLASAASCLDAYVAMLVVAVISLNSFYNLC